jgi:cytoskeletal protein CcmA (bactofilin family)
MASQSSSSADEAAPDQHKPAREWGELVGFRRREASHVEHETPRPEESNGDGVVVIGKGASIVGEITNCSQVEIAGALEGKVVAEAVIVRAGGCLKGQVCSERAEVHGTIEGEVQVEDHLDIRSTGDVSGELAYGKLSVASGGRLAGNIQIVSELHKKELASMPTQASLPTQAVVPNDVGADEDGASD